MNSKSERRDDAHGLAPENAKGGRSMDGRARGEAAAGAVFERELEASMRVRARWVAVVMCAIWLYALAITDITLYGAADARLHLRIIQLVTGVTVALLLGRARSLNETELIATGGACLLSVLGATSLLKLNENAFGFSVAFRLFAPLFAAYFLGLRWRSVLVLDAVSWIAVTMAAYQRNPERVREQLVLVVMVVGVPSLLLAYEAAGRERRRRQEVALREALHLANRRLHAEEEARTRLFINLNHDFRTPLALMRAEAELLRKELGDAAQREALERIEANSQYLADLSEQLMELARLETGPASHQPTPTRVDLVAREVAAQLQPPSGTPALVVAGGAATASADPIHVRRILFNLVENARRQPAVREVTITMRSEDAHVVAEVADDGAGIAADRRARIFERFASFDKDGRTVSGIGLPLSRELAELNGGSLTLMPDDPRTTFRLVLPAATATKEAGTTAKEAGTAAKTDESASSPRRPLLLVEDHAEMRAILTRLLGGAFAVHVTETLAAAREQLETLVPAAVVTDLMLPDGHGSELIAELRSRRRHEGVPVLIVSALGTAPDRVKGLQAGADDYLAKPFSPAELLSRVNAAIARSEARRHALQKQREEFVMELHDGVAASLARAALLIDVGRPESALTSIREGLSEARALMNLFEAPPAALGAVVVELRREMEQSCAQVGMQLAFEAVAGDGGLLLSSAERHTLLRVAREALTNVLKHAGAQHVWCRLHLRGSTLLLCVEDDGVGMGESLPGRGIATLKRRAELLGGNVDLGTRSPTGTRVELCLPLANAAAPEREAEVA